MTAAIHAMRRVKRSAAINLWTALRRRLPTLFLAGVAIALPLRAQTTSPVQFTGQTRLTWETANRQQFGQQLPPAFLRWDLNSVLNLYGLPLSINALATTEDRYTAQPISAFSIGLSRTDLQQQIRRKIDERIGALADLEGRLQSLGPSTAADSLKALGARLAGGTTPEAAIAKLEDLRNLKETDLQDHMEDLQAMGLASATQGIASLFPTIILGTGYPTYTKLTLDGIPLTGGQIECTPGPFYIALAGGQVQSATGGLTSYLSVFSQGAYRRKLLAGRFGLGAKDETHLYVSLVYGADDAGSLTRDSLYSSLTPQKNAVVDIEGRAYLLEERLTFGGEVAYSARTADIQAPGPGDVSLPSWLGSLVDLNSTSSADVAFSLDGTYAVRSNGTSISGSFRRVGPGYQSPGAPYLRSDEMRYEGKLEQAFLQKQLTLSAFYRHDEDNLDNLKAYSTTVDALGGQVSLNFQNLPYVRFSYAPLSQVSRILSDSLHIDTDVLAVTASTGYSFRTSGGVTSTTALSFLYNEGTTMTANGKYLSRNVMLFQNIGFASPVSVALGLGYLNTVLGTTATTTITTDLSVTYIAFSTWATTAGVSLLRDAVRRTGTYVRSSIPTWTGGNIELWGEYNRYSDDTQDFDEAALRVVISQTW
jgi:hypothetical protein